MRRLVCLLGLVVISCGHVAAPVSHTAVNLVEGGITVEQPTLSSGAVALEVVNTGQYEHTLVVTSSAGQVIAATGLVAPGESVQLPVTLAPGGYQFSCRIVVSGPDGAVFDHYQMGMKAEITVVAG